MRSSVVSALWVTSFGVRKSVYTRPMGSPNLMPSPVSGLLGSFSDVPSLSPEHAVNVAVVASIAAISSSESSLFFLIVV